MTTAIRPGQQQMGPGGPMGSAYRLLTLALLALVTIIAFEAMAISTAMPQVAKDLDAVRSYGLAFSFMLTAELLGIVLAGVWADRRGPLPSLFAGQLLMAAGSAMAGLAPTFTMLLAGRLIAGLGAADVPWTARGDDEPVPADRLLQRRPDVHPAHARQRAAPGPHHRRHHAHRRSARLVVRLLRPGSPCTEQPPVRAHRRRGRVAGSRHPPACRDRRLRIALLPGGACYRSVRPGHGAGHVIDLGALPLPLTGQRPRPHLLVTAGVRRPRERSGDLGGRRGVRRDAQPARLGHPRVRAHVGVPGGGRRPRDVRRSTHQDVTSRGGQPGPATMG